MTKNLQNLVTQLQTMENSMISIMFDLATKLASLSDISFFLLIETRGKTKFTGSRHLTEAYLMSNLTDIIDSGGPEIELQFDKTPVPKVVLARPKTPRMPEIGKKQTSPPLKRRLSESSLNVEPAYSTNEKKFKVTQNEADNGEEVITFGEDAVSSTRLDSAYIVDCSSSSLQLARVGQNEDLNRYDEGGEGEGEAVGSPKSRYIGGADEKFSAHSPTDSDRRFVVDDSDHAASSSPTDALQESLLLQEWDVESFLDRSEKLKYIRTVDTPSLVLDKESTEFKLLHSLIYELSKNAATFCPFHASDARTSQFFAHVFESFWNRVPYLQQLQDERVLPGDKATSKYKNLKSLLRWKVQKNFGVLMRKYNIKRKFSL